MSSLFQTLLDSMLQCILDLWDAADSAEKKTMLIQGLDELLGRLKLLHKTPEMVASEGDLSQTAFSQPSLVNQARDMLSVILGAAGLLEKHEQQLSQERRAEEFGKIRSAVQKFALLLDEVTI